MKTITLDNGTYNVISLYAKLNDISVADALKVSVKALLLNPNSKARSSAVDYYMSPKVKALETGFQNSGTLSSDYKTELLDALAEKYL